MRTSTLPVSLLSAVTLTLTATSHWPTGARAVPVCPSTPKAMATTWYTGWHAQYLPLDEFSWEKYSAVSYAFAETTQDVNTLGLQDADAVLLPEFVEHAHQHNVAAILTVGGWTGSQYFSTAVNSATNRTAFVQTVLQMVKRYNLDGVDFDWEYPNKQGMGCNIMSPEDTPNFLAFLKELRATPGGQNMTISAASSIVPFASQDGTPSTDVAEFANILDYVAVMDYDIWGSWSSAVGPNSPLDDTCASPDRQQGSAVSAVNAWTAAGFPADQILLAVASYGHSYHVSQAAAFNVPTDQPSALSTLLADGSIGTSQYPGTQPIAAYPAFDAGQQPMGDSWDIASSPGTDQCGNPTGGGFSGIFNFRGLVEKGWLNEGGNPVEGMGYRFDNCSQTPFLYDPTTSTMVSYDDPNSFAAKGQFIREKGLLGFAMWEAVGDYGDLLLDAIESGMGIGDTC
ncbi:glycoside hydrolase [Trametopsis cervina]|nr:glycoside hydrolase [Trametopsis cervina]